jgi:phage terminase small subunit
MDAQPLPPTTPPKLTARQRLFVAHYLDCLNATEAARRAGYAEPNTQGPRMLVNVGIHAEIQAGLAEKSMPADEVLARLSAIGRADIRDLMRFRETDRTETNGTVSEPAGAFVGIRLDRDAPLHLIKSLTPNRYGMKLELHDQQTALTTLARVHGLLNAFDWSKVPAAIVEALADGRITIDDLKRLAAPSPE